MSFAEGKIAQLLKECDVEAQNPLDGLLEVVRNAGAMFRMLGALVGELDPVGSAALQGMDEEGRPTYRWMGFTGRNHVGEEVPNVYVQLYGQWADRYARACKLALDAGIDERMIRNAEITTQVLFDAVGKALSAIDLTHDQQDIFRRTLGSELRKLSGPGELAAVTRGGG